MISSNRLFCIHFVFFRVFSPFAIDWAQRWSQLSALAEIKFHLFISMFSDYLFYSSPCWCDEWDEKFWPKIRHDFLLKWNLEIVWQTKSLDSTTKATEDRWNRWDFICIGCSRLRSSLSLSLFAEIDSTTRHCTSINFTMRQQSLAKFWKFYGLENC